MPGSMGTHSYIVRGRGNAESFDSCAHGAGRRMSRGAAKRQFTTADLMEQTTGIECRKDAGVIDEIPDAYKESTKNRVALASELEFLQSFGCSLRSAPQAWFN